MHMPVDFMVCSSLSFSRLVQGRDIALSSRQPVVTTQCFLNFVFPEHRLADTVTCFMPFKIVIILWKTLHSLTDIHWKGETTWKDIESNKYTVKINSNRNKRNANLSLCVFWSLFYSLLIWISPIELNLYYIITQTLCCSF